MKNFTAQAGLNHSPGQPSFAAYFISPLGETNRVYGFCNRGTNWEIRFRPDTCGRWKYFTTCSDTKSTALHDQHGEFLCTAPARGSAFAEHGPLQISRDGRHFEYADHTPLMLVLETGKSNALSMPQATWTDHIQRLTSGKVTAQLVSLWPGTNSLGQPALRHSKQLEINDEALREMDARVDALNQAGLVAVVAPLWEIGVTDRELLSEDEAISAWRHAIARWGANQVLWVFACEGQGLGAKVSRWKKIGRAVFGNTPHAPVIFFPGSTAWLMDEFRDEPWVNAFGFQTTDANQPEALRWVLMGPLASEWRKHPARPLLNLAPGGNSRFSWWSLLLAPPCGFSVISTPNGLAASEILRAADFARLTPAPRVLSKQPGYESPESFVAAAASENRDLTVCYVPAGQAVELANRFLPVSPKAYWYNPQSAEKQTAIGSSNEIRTRFTAPTKSDWLLIIATGPG